MTPAYFETALKAKYSRDSETSQMLDIIVDGIYLDLSYIYGGSVNAPIGKIRGILASDRNCENAVSSLAKQEKATMKSLEKLLQKYEDIK